MAKKKPKPSLAEPSFQAQARQILEKAREEMRHLHNRTLDRDGDYSASPVTFRGLEGLKQLISEIPK